MDIPEHLQTSAAPEEWARALADVPTHSPDVLKKWFAAAFRVGTAIERGRISQVIQAAATDRALDDYRRKD